MELYGDKIGEHPVGTGPFVLKSCGAHRKSCWSATPLTVRRYYDAQPAADDAEGQVLLARFKQRRLPMVTGLEVAIIEENQPRWLSF